MKKLLFIYNPNAGTGKLRPKLSVILETFAQRGYLATVCPTAKAGDATLFARRLGPKFDRVVCAGGDGTLHEVAAGLLELEKPPVLGYIPAGTANDVSRNLNLPRDVAAAATWAVSGHTISYDMGRFNGDPFVYVSAFGLFTDVAYATPQTLKNVFGHLAYVLNCAAALTHIPTYQLRLEHDTGVVEGEFMVGLISNTRSVGGFKGILPAEARLDDGLFEVILARKPHSASEVKSMLTSVLRHDAQAGGPVITLRSGSVRVTSPKPIPWTMDGEFGGEHDTVEIETIPHALDICRRPET